MRREARIVIAFPCSLNHACVLGGGGGGRSEVFRSGGRCTFYGAHTGRP